MAKHPPSKVSFPSSDLQAFGLLWEGWLDSEIQKRELAKDRIADIERLNQLCVERGIPDNPLKFTSLALQLAREAYPEGKLKGRKGKWNELIRGALVVEVERLTSENPAHSVSWACQVLSKREPWQSFLETRNGPSTIGSDPTEALRKAYVKSKHQRGTLVMRDAYALYVHQNTPSRWIDLVGDLLKDQKRKAESWD